MSDAGGGPGRRNRAALHRGSDRFGTEPSLSERKLRSTGPACLSVRRLTLSSARVARLDQRPTSGKATGDPPRVSATPGRPTNANRTRRSRSEDGGSSRRSSPATCASRAASVQPERGDRTALTVRPGSARSSTVGQGGLLKEPLGNKESTGVPDARPDRTRHSRVRSGHCHPIIRGSNEETTVCQRLVWLCPPYIAFRSNTRDGRGPTVRTTDFRFRSPAPPTRGCIALPCVRPPGSRG